MRIRVQPRRHRATSGFLSRTLCMLFLFSCCSTAVAAPLAVNETPLFELFPRAGLEDRVEFWKQIFTKYGEVDAVFHDRDDLRLIYEVLSFEKAAESSAREDLRQKRLRKQKERELKTILTDLSRSDLGPDGRGKSGLAPRHKDVLDLLLSLGYSPSRSLLRKLADNIRSQRGIKEKFAGSVILSGKYLLAMEQILTEAGLPPELAFLPHVESSFNYESRSKKGAAGIWQFMPSTGRRFLRITSYVDERLDPLTATRAAAQFLKENYTRLKTWPLAITAYNHGPSGMARARRLHGADFPAIIEKYQSRRFGFASQNFYAEFLAAMDIARNHEFFLGPLEIAAPLEFETLHPKRRYRVTEITEIPGLSETLLREYNPHFTRAVWRGTRTLPAGLGLRVPPGKGEEVERLLDSAPQQPERVFRTDADSYRVRRGDTLSTIARSFGMNVEDLQQANGISNPHKLRAGQVLKLAESSETRRYQVRRGDTLISIAMRFGVSLEALLRTNQVRNRHRIFPGQLLLIHL